MTTSNQSTEVSWSDAVRTIRIERNLSQRGLAELLGVSQASVSQMENGQIKDVSWTVGSKIKALLEKIEEDLKEAASNE